MVSSIDDETDLSLNKWGDVNDDEHTLKILDEELEVYQLTENIMVLVNTLPNMKYKMRFQRIATDEKLSRSGWSANGRFPSAMPKPMEYGLKQSAIIHWSVGVTLPKAGFSLPIRAGLLRNGKTTI